jgi:hypothetical protein
MSPEETRQEDVSMYRHQDLHREAIVTTEKEEAS